MYFSINRRWLGAMITLIALISGLLGANLFAVYGATDKDKDTEKGKAPTEIEEAIAAGETLSNFTGYSYGAGHEASGGVIGSTRPKFLDCSAFTRWAYMHGAGLDAGAYVVTPNGVSASGLNKYKKHATNGWKSLKRGDLVVAEGGGHILIYLGNNKFLGCNGSGTNNFNASNGVEVTGGSYWDKSFTGVYIDMQEAIKHKGDWSTNHAKDVKGNMNGSTGDASQAKSSSSDNGQYTREYNPFTPMNTVTTGLGMDTGNNLTGAFMGNSTVMAASSISSDLTVKASYVAMVASIFLFTYATVVLVLYLVLPHSGGAVMNAFEKLSGLDGYQSSNNTKSIIFAYLIMVCMLVVVMTGAYIPVLAGFYSLLGQLIALV